MMHVRGAFLARIREWKNIVWETLRTFSEIDGEQRAASFAYYALFSLFPLLALLLTMGSALFEPEAVIQTVERFFPLASSQQEFIWNMVALLEQSRRSVTLVSFLILVWCSLRFFHALVRGINRAWHTIEIPWWQLTFRNLLMIFVLASALMIGLIAPALLQAVRIILVEFGEFMKSQFPMMNFELIGIVFDWSRFALASAILFYVSSLLYMFAPRRRVFFRQVWVAALFVTIALQVCQNAFVNYVPRFVNYNAIYGTVGILMLLLLWVYVSGVIIIFGGCLCAAGARMRENEMHSITPSTEEN